jgi:hypothetical protein
MWRPLLCGGKAAAGGIGWGKAIVQSVCIPVRKGRSSLKQNGFRLNRYFALAHCLSMIFSENRFPLFGIML